MLPRADRVGAVLLTLLALGAVRCNQDTRCPPHAELEKEVLAGLGLSDFGWDLTLCLLQGRTVQGRGLGSGGEGPDREAACQAYGCVEREMLLFTESRIQHAMFRRMIAWLEGDAQPRRLLLLEMIPTPGRGTYMFLLVVIPKSGQARCLTSYDLAADGEDMIRFHSFPLEAEQVRAIEQGMDRQTKGLRPAVFWSTDGADQDVAILHDLREDGPNWHSVLKGVGFQVTGRYFSGADHLLLGRVPDEGETMRIIQHHLVENGSAADPLMPRAVASFARADQGDGDWQLARRKYICPFVALWWKVVRPDEPSFLTQAERAAFWADQEKRTTGAEY